MSYFQLISKSEEPDRLRELCVESLPQLARLGLEAECDDELIAPSQLREWALQHCDLPTYRALLIGLILGTFRASASLDNSAVAYPGFHSALHVLRLPDDLLEAFPPEEPQPELLLQLVETTEQELERRWAGDPPSCDRQHSAVARYTAFDLGFQMSLLFGLASHVDTADGEKAQSFETLVLDVCHKKLTPKFELLAVESPTGNFALSCRDFSHAIERSIAADSKKIAGGEAIEEAIAAMQIHHAAEVSGAFELGSVLGTLYGICLVAHELGTPESREVAVDSYTELRPQAQLAFEWYTDLRTGLPELEESPAMLPCIMATIDDLRETLRVRWGAPEPEPISNRWKTLCPLRPARD